MNSQEQGERRWTTRGIIAIVCFVLARLCCWAVGIKPRTTDGRAFLVLSLAAAAIAITTVSLGREC